MAAINRIEALAEFIEARNELRFRAEVVRRVRAEIGRADDEGGRRRALIDEMLKLLHFPGRTPTSCVVLCESVLKELRAAT